MIKLDTMNDSIEVLKLSNRIIKGEFNKNWKAFLEHIEQIYGVDGALLAFLENGALKFKYLSPRLESLLKNTTILESQLNLEREYEEKLLKNGYIFLESLEKCKKEMNLRIDAGINRALLLPIKSNNSFYGLLILILSRKEVFDHKDIEPLKLIADSIASEIDKQKYLKQLEIEREKSEKHIELLKFLDQKLSQNVSRETVVESLKKIKSLLSLERMCFLFAPEDLYLELNEDSLFGSISLSKNKPIYDVWRTNTTVITEICTPDRKYKHVIFIPIVHRNNTIAVFAFAFQNDPPNTLRIELENIKTALTHFITMLHTYRNIKIVASELSETEEGLIQAFVSTTEAKDIYTKGHSEHVAHYSKIIAKKLHLDREQQEMIYNAGLLHDIGKIGIPDMILLKPGRLTPFEYEIMKYHPLISYEIVKNIPKFRGIAQCIRHHHERIDGSGYPDGLKGEKIELGAKILAIADIFDALTTDRPYRKALKPKEAIKILKKEKVDQGILKKVENDLVNSFIKELPSSTFIPEQIEKLRKEIIDLDFATGLKRRQFIVRIMDDYIEQSKPFTLFLVDIKNTAYINFKYGRDVASRVIMFVADELKKILKEEPIARVGTDEFMFIYKYKEPENFKKRIQNALRKGISEKIKNKNCVIDERELKESIGCYITFAHYPEDGKTSEELLYRCYLKKKVESCQYYAKIYN